MACPAYQVSAEDAAYAEALSRYPKVQPRKHDWAAAANGAPQFEGYDDGLRPPADDDDDEAAEPFEYSGEHLQACNFPLGSFGTGRVLLCGDGTMKEWTVVNQVRTDDGGPGDAPQPLDDMPANFFAISATPAGGKVQTYALVTPQNYTDANVALHPNREAHVSQHEVRRMQTMPGIKALTMVCRYPVAETVYEIPGLPVQVSMEALSPAIPGDSKSSCIPVAIFQFTLKNTGATAVTVSLMEAQQNFIGWDGKLDCTPGKTTQWGGNVSTHAIGCVCTCTILPIACDLEPFCDRLLAITAGQHPLPDEGRRRAVDELHKGGADRGRHLRHARRLRAGRRWHEDRGDLAGRLGGGPIRGIRWREDGADNGGSYAAFRRGHFLLRRRGADGDGAGGRDEDRGLLPRVALS
jgi:hypothetical protein